MVLDRVSYSFLESCITKIRDRLNLVDLDCGCPGYMRLRHAKIRLAGRLWSSVQPTKLWMASAYNDSRTVWAALRYAGPVKDSGIRSKRKPKTKEEDFNPVAQARDVGREVQNGRIAYMKLNLTGKSRALLSITSNASELVDELILYHHENGTLESMIAPIVPKNTRHNRPRLVKLFAYDAWLRVTGRKVQGGKRGRPKGKEKRSQASLSTNPENIALLGAKTSAELNNRLDWLLRRVYDEIITRIQDERLMPAMRLMAYAVAGMSLAAVTCAAILWMPA